MRSVDVPQGADYIDVFKMARKALRKRDHVLFMCRDHEELMREYDVWDDEVMMPYGEKPIKLAPL